MPLIEEWKAITGYEGLYEVSNLGRVKSLNYRGTGKCQLMTGGSLSAGYRYVVLSRDGKTHNQLVHRLVATEFLPNPSNLPQVNHIDEDKSNNCVSNLQWCTPKENMQHGTRLARSKDTRRKNAIGFKPVKCSNGKIYSSTKEAARDLGIQASGIRNHLAGRYLTTHGYTFEYLGDKEWSNVSL